LRKAASVHVPTAATRGSSRTRAAWDTRAGHFCEALAVRIRDDVAERFELPPDKVPVTLKQKALGRITITATVGSRPKPTIFG
jgi:hypothetical protein